MERDAFFPALSSLPLYDGGLTVFFLSWPITIIAVTQPLVQSDS